MAFPQDRLGTVVQMKIDDVWTDVVRYDSRTKILNEPGVSISRGQGGLQSETPAGTCRWEWDDPNGIYNNENPRSPYFGKLARNTPVRVYVPRAATALLLVSPGKLLSGTVRTAPISGECWAPDSAALSITGDIDIRIDVDIARIRRTGFGQYIVGKYTTTGNQRSWLLYLSSEGLVRYRWSVDGSAITGSVISTAGLPNTGRIAIRVTHDVDNGAAGNTVTFYTATTLSGSYTQLGSAVVTAGTTSIFDSTAGIELAAAGAAIGSTPVSPITSNYPLIGRIYGFELCSSIGGSVVANPDFTAEAVGTTSFVDDHSNTWTVTPVTGIPDSAYITNADYRFYGEFSEPVMRPNKSSSGSGTDVKIIAEAGGIIRRLTANETPLQSAITLAMKTYVTNGWWPGEDATTADTTSASSGTDGVQPAIINDITFAGYDATLAGSAGVMVCGSTGPVFSGICKTVTSTGHASFVGYFKFPSLPASNQTMFSIYSNSGTIRRWDFVVGATTYDLNGYNSAGTLTVNKNTLHGVGTEPTNWICYHLGITQNGANVDDIRSEWFAVGTDLYLSQTAVGTTTYAGTTGVFDRVGVQGVAALADVRFAQLMTTSNTGFNTIFYDAPELEFAQFSRGFAGELAGDRFERVAPLIGARPILIGDAADTEAMGAQPIDTGMNILYQCAVVDGGVITESVDQEAALEYRTRISLCNSFGLELTWAQLSTGLEATPDNADVANDITLTRDNGGSARAFLEFGPMSIQESPNGINVVPDGPNCNNYLDSRLPALVQQMLLVRTWPESRYPSVKIEMHRSPFTASATLALLAQKTLITDIITITSLPTFMAPAPLYLLAKGITEELKNHTWDITWAMVPYGPYRNSELLTSVSGGPYLFVAAHDTVAGVVQTQLNADCTSSATQIVANTLTGAATIDPALVSMVIKIAGERMTVREASEIGSVAVELGQFETGITNWTAAGGSGTQSTAQAHGGANSYLITVSGSPAQATLRTANAIRPVIVAGESYRISFWIYLSITSANVNCVINWQNSVGGAISSSGSSAVTVQANTWTKVTNTATAPALTTQCTYGPTVAGSPANGTLIYFDGLDLAKTTNVVGQPQTLTVTRGLDSYTAAHTAGDYITADPILKARL